MRQNELMVGDWVKLDFYDVPYGDEEDAVWKNGKITAIHHGNWVDVNFGDPRDECDIEVEDIHPIQLTEDILQKNFPTPEEIVWWPLNDGSFRVEMQDDTHLIIGKYNYVHELQHALRLFGKDGEIEL
jgi:hypothetical protein